VIYVGDFLPRLRAGRVALLHLGGRPGEPGHRLHWDEFVRRINFELANEWGNLVNRSVSMAHRNVGAIPKPVVPTEADAALLATSKAGFDTVGELLARSRFKQALGEAMRVVGAANKYISDQEPWKQKDDPDRARHHPAPPRCRSCRTRTRCSRRSCRMPRSSARGARRTGVLGRAAGDPPGGRPGLRC